FGDANDISWLSYGDPAAGLIVSFLVLKLAYEMARDSMDILMEKTISEQMLLDYSSLISSVSAVRRIDRLRAREHGHYILVDVRVSIPAEMTIQEGHDVSREIKKAIMDKHDDVVEVMTHLNPWYKES